MTAGGGRRTERFRRSFDFEFFGGTAGIGPLGEPFGRAAVAVPGDVGIFGVAVFGRFLAGIPFLFFSFQKPQGFVQRDAHFFGELGDSGFELCPGFAAAPLEFVVDVFLELFEFFDRERGEIHDVFQMEWMKSLL